MNKKQFIKRISIDILIISIIFVGSAIGFWRTRILDMLSISNSDLTSIRLSVDLDAIPIEDPSSFIKLIQDNKTTNISLNNNSVHSFNILRIINLENSENPQNNNNSFTSNNKYSRYYLTSRIILTGKANLIESGLNLKGDSIKIGTKVTLISPLYILKGVISNISLQ